MKFQHKGGRVKHKGGKEGSFNMTEGRKEGGFSMKEGGKEGGFSTKEGGFSMTE